MPVRPKRPAAAVALSVPAARRLWLRAQRLDQAAPFGDGPAATTAAVEHLGYVQIDTINVVERCHHHILWSRIPGYRRADLGRAQSVDKTLFEYWTHALSYVPVRDYRFYAGDMKARRAKPSAWYGMVTPGELKKVIGRIRDEGALSIRDIDDDVLVEKNHPWASRKPSKRALQLAFYGGALTISERSGMLKTYELTERHFGWDAPPRAASRSQVVEYLLDRALRAQGIVSLDSVCYLIAGFRPDVRAAIEARVARRTLVPVAVDGAGKTEHWAEPAALETAAASEKEGPPPGLVHILSPFDPLVIQRKRLALFFGYDHLFEAYLPKDKRRYGYFALPVLAGDEIVAAVDLKADRTAKALKIQQWTWVGRGSAAEHQGMIDEALGRFEGFQFGD